jgi:hypothetical protein
MVAASRRGIGYTASITRYPQIRITRDYAAGNLCADGGCQYTVSYSRQHTRRKQMQRQVGSACDQHRPRRAHQQTSITLCFSSSA